MSAVEDFPFIFQQFENLNSSSVIRKRHLFQVIFNVVEQLRNKLAHVITYFIATVNCLSIFSLEDNICVCVRVRVTDQVSTQRREVT